MTLKPITAPKKPGTPNLDELFGRLEIPDRRDPLEKAICPQSRERLNRETAERLLALMAATEKGLGVSRFVYCEFPSGLSFFEGDGFARLGPIKPRDCGRTS